MDKTVQAAGGRPVLVYLPVEKTELLRRREMHNQRDDTNALAASPQALDDFCARFEPPAEDEDVVTYNGDIEAIRSMAQ
ncbi:hypothetical protein [Streptomyces sp. NPDC002790]|uniref:hypothetical protein n=1 Tax=Streptomyces sp. NPDC002790 TaxID=3154431 RepID=UPI00331F23C0